MFRNPRENADLLPEHRLNPSVGRPPSPLGIFKPRHEKVEFDDPENAKMKSSQIKSSRKKPQKPRQTTLSFEKHSQSSSGSNGGKGNLTTSTKPNGNIMTFFKKMEAKENALFVEDRKGSVTKVVVELDKDDDIDANSETSSFDSASQDHFGRFNELGGSVKRRKLSNELQKKECTPPPELFEDPGETPDIVVAENNVRIIKRTRHVGPFIQDSDSEDDLQEDEKVSAERDLESEDIKADFTTMVADCSEVQQLNDAPIATTNENNPHSKQETTDFVVDDNYGYFERADEFELEEAFERGEEYVERRYMEQQRRLEMENGACEGDLDGLYQEDMDTAEPADGIEILQPPVEATSCPICSISLAGIEDMDASIHVNNCLDGNPTPLPERKLLVPPHPSKEPTNGRQFRRPDHPVKPGQSNPFSFEMTTKKTGSAFTKIMSGHAEDAAWATAAKSQAEARGKPAFQRTCPFYKIMPGFNICVDAFRYGAVKDCNAYFLSHFHSDHYIGLTASWCHGPIYCSRVTANLVRQQLRVDPKWVVDLEFEQKVDVPNTPGVAVTMIPANHCPGSSLFLFEKATGTGKASRNQRVLHCGDFRACKAHIEHPLLRPNVLNEIGDKIGQQRIDCCYLDTTYLNPKYAFPSQEDVIMACADMCVSLSKDIVDESDSWERMKRERAGDGMIKFVQKNSDAPIKEEPQDVVDAMQVQSKSTGKTRGKLLVVVGTYSIGKERICLGIARALGSKIYAPPGKQRICACLEDPELNALLTRDPREAQVHMTPLFEIRADTLDDYLKDYSNHFSRAVGFRPSGWNYRPPNSRFTENPSVQAVLHSANWKSVYSMKDLMPQRGSTSRASCFGVPYSEHSSFRELTMFCCALRIDKIIPTVNIGSAKSREKMKMWIDKWAAEKKKNGLFHFDNE